jgi:hypothetical protein
VVRRSYSPESSPGFRLWWLEEVRRGKYRTDLMVAPTEVTVPGLMRDFFEGGLEAVHVTALAKTVVAHQHVVFVVRPLARVAVVVGCL